MVGLIHQGRQDPSCLGNVVMMHIDEQYQKALDYIYSFVDYSLSRNLHVTEDTFNLNRMINLMRFLDNPQNHYRTIHVAGTKGKGSTAAFIASALKHSGYKTGFYTSPHLSDFCERIQVNGKSISRKDLILVLQCIQPWMSKIPKITTFEIITAIAFFYFAQENVDYAVIEVGLGGRLDATNVIVPEVSVITSLSMDHMAILGNTLGEIAKEKAGIVKPGVPVVSAPQKEIALNVLKQRALALRCPLYIAGHDVKYFPISHNLRMQKFKILSHDQEEVVITTPLLGFHQIINAATAFEALLRLRSKDRRITNRNIIRGFKRVRWPARFEIIKRKPFIVLDSAHNEDSAERLTQSLIDYFPGKKITLIFGASEDKNIEGMLEKLSKICHLFIASKSTHPRAMDPEKILQISKPYFAKNVSAPTIEDAIDNAISHSGKNDVILITGSIFIAAAAREFILKNE